MPRRLIRTGKAAAGAPKTLYTAVRDDGVDGLRRAKNGAAWRLASNVSRRFVKHAWNPGTQVWERDWDVLLVLDACRRDLMCEVADEFAFVGGRENVGAHWSVGSKSDEWLRRTFVDEYADEIERTAYVTGNPYTAKSPFSTEPAVLDEVWRDAWGEDRGTVPARAITDRAIDTWREGGVDRMIVHYMQPHIPFVSDSDHDLFADPTDLVDGHDGFWRPALSMDEVWPDYRDNLRYVLDDVSHLLTNLDAETVAISADHGNATGTLGVWGHPSDLLLPSIRRVPWVETSATDTGGYDPDVDRTSEDEDFDVEERLQALGYAE